MALTKIEYYRRLSYQKKKKRTSDDSEDEFMEDETDFLNLKYLPNREKKKKKPKFELIPAQDSHKAVTNKNLRLQQETKGFSLMQPSLSKRSSASIPDEENRLLP